MCVGRPVPPAWADGEAGRDGAVRGLHIFAGRHVHGDSVSGWAHVLGHEVVDLDTALGGAAQDVVAPALRLERLERFVELLPLTVLFGQQNEYRRAGLLSDAPQERVDSSL